MLRIPTSLDNPPPLLAPLGDQVEEVLKSKGAVKNPKKRRRRKKSAGGEDHSWERAPKASHSRRGEQQKMRMMLIAGGLLFTAIVAGVVISMIGGPTPVTDDKVVGMASAEGKPDQSAAPPVNMRSEAVIISEAEPMARRFLEATTVEEILSVVRNPEVAGVRMREFYPSGKIDAPGMSQFNTGRGLVTKGKLYSFPVLTRDHEEKALGFVETSQGLKIDWESWVGWSEISWQKFLSTKPVAASVFRVILSPVDYYNFGFSDESKWRSYRLESPDKEHSVYGYVEKDSMLDQRIRPNAEQKSILLTLSLKFPADPQSASQVQIERFVCEGWVDEGGAP